MNPYGFLFLIITALGILGIIFVTIPSIYGVADGINSVINQSNDSGKIIGAVVGGVLLWLTTGLFIALIAIGLLLTLLALAD